MRPAVTCAIVFLCHFTSASNSSSTLVLGCAPTHRRRFDHRDDVLMVYLRRIRKAGSTTIFRGLQHFFNTSGRLQADEQNPINGRCVVTEVYHLKTGWNGSLPLVPSPSVLSRILFVTHLREPLARQKSEFYYVGPGSKRAAQKRGGPARNTDAEWFTWISEGTRAREQGNHSCVIHGSQYLDNVMVRALGADCGSCRFAKAPPHLRGCQLCGRHGRPPQLERVGTLQLQRATNVLEAFDLVIILELLGDPAHLRIISRVLLLPRGFTFGHARTVPAAHDPARQIPPRVEAHLKRDNAPDIALYRDFRSRAECEMNAPQQQKRKAPRIKGAS